MIDVALTFRLNACDMMMKNYLYINTQNLHSPRIYFRVNRYLQSGIKKLLYFYMTEHKPDSSWPFSTVGSIDIFLPCSNGLMAAAIIGRAGALDSFSGSTDFFFSLIF